MNTQEAAIIVAEFDGWKRFAFNGVQMWRRDDMPIGTDLFGYRLGRVEQKYLSLDALVPVWEKLRLVPDFELIKDTCYARIITTTMMKSAISGTIQESALIVTAKAIKSLKESE